MLRSLFKRGSAAEPANPVKPGNSVGQRSPQQTRAALNNMFSPMRKRHRRPMLQSLAQMRRAIAWNLAITQTARRGRCANSQWLPKQCPCLDMYRGAMELRDLLL